MCGLARVSVCGSYKCSSSPVVGELWAVIGWEGMWELQIPLLVARYVRLAIELTGVLELGLAVMPRVFVWPRSVVAALRW